MKTFKKIFLGIGVSASLTLIGIGIMLCMNLPKGAYFIIAGIVLGAFLLCIVDVDDNSPVPISAPDSDTEDDEE